MPLRWALRGALWTSALIAGVSLVWPGESPVFTQPSTSPGGVGGAALWVKANNGVVENGSDQVEQWLDQSGGGNTSTELRASLPTHTSAIAPSAAIVRVANAINFNPAVDFSGATGRSLKGNAATAWSTGPLSIFAVSVPEGSSAGFISGVWDSLRDWTANDSTSAGAGILVTQSGANYALDSSGAVIAPTTSPINRPRVVRVLYLTATNTLGGSTWLDGVQESTGTNRATNATTLFEVGGRTAGTATFDNRILNGKIAEVVVYKSALTPADTNKIESYLALKYGITLRQTPSVQNYTDSTGAAVWNGTVNATHNGNIAGIGRDDTSGLDQRQSQSINTANSGNLVTMGLSTIATDNASNPSTFATDRSFLVWGDDAASVAFTTPIVSPAFGSTVRMTRTWRVEETSTVGTIRLGVPATVVPTTLLYLVVSNDAVFDNTDQWVSMTPFTAGAAAYRVADVDLTTGQYFTFAQVQETDLAIAKTDGQSSYVPGAPISYTIVVTNAGPSNATGISIADTVPPSIGGVTVSCAATGAAACGTNASAGNNVSFTGASVNAGAGNQLTITIGGTVSASTSGNLTNTATVSPGAGQADLNVANSTASDIDTQGTGSADLAIAKSDGQAGYTAGTPITYTIAVTNAGPSNASALDVTDVVPASITGVSVLCTAAGAAVCGANGSSGNTVSFTGASVGAGAGNSLTLTVSGTVSPGATGNLTNTAQVTVPGGAGYSDPNLGNNTASDVDTQGTPVIDLAIAKSDGQASYVPGALITYTLTVTNAGPSTATGFAVTDVLPPGVSAATATCALVGLGSCGTNGSTGSTVSFTNLLLAPGAVNTLTFTVTGTASAATTGTLTNTATVTAAAGSNEPNLTNNSASDVDTQGAGEADLAITKTDGQSGAVPGTAVSYTLVVTNLGPSNAPSFEIHDTVPSMIDAVTVSCMSNGTATCGTNASSGNAIAFTGASLDAGAVQSLTLTISGVVNPSYTGGNIVNAAQVMVPSGAGYTDPQLGNNSVSDADTALPQQVDLAITKTDAQTSYTPGAPIAYTLVVTNAGPSTASGVSIADLVPASITGVTASCVATGIANCGSNVSAGNSVAFSNASVYPGAGHQLTIAVTGVLDPDTTGNLVNMASVTKGLDATESNVANNSTTDTDNQGANIANLAITKTDGAATYIAGATTTYQIVVTNTGPSHADGFTIDDTLPPAILGPVVTCAVTSGVGSCGTDVSAGNAISFTGARLNAGSALTLTIGATIDPSATGNLANTATLFVPGGAAFTDPDLSNDAATDTDTPGAQTVDLAIAKSNGQTAYVAGSAVTYTVTVTNAGPSTATGFSISDAVPPAISGLTVTCTPTGASNCGSNSSSGQNVLFSNATLVPGDTLTLVIAGTIAPGATGDLINQASVVAGFGVVDTNPANDVATDTDTPASAQVDLAITKTDGQASYVPGMPIGYTVVVSNGGPSLAAGFSVADVVPAAVTGLTVHCAVTGTGSCGTNLTAGNSVSFADLTLAPGAGHQLTFTIGGTVSPSANGNLVNTATVTAGAGSAESNAANDSATDTDGAVVRADIGVSKAGPASAGPGTTMTYTITVTNSGPSVSAPVTLTDPVPGGLTLVSVSDACIALPCALGALSPGDSRNVTVRMAVAPGYSGGNPILNTASVTSSTDPNAANDSATASTTLTAATADLVVTKTGPASVKKGSTIAYTITVANAGPATAAGVTLDDPPPSGLTLTSVAGACPTLPCSLSPLAPGEVRTITARYHVPASYSLPAIANTATVSSTTVDPDLTNDASSVSTLVTGLTCDVNGDGISELITGAGPGGGPHVRVWDVAAPFAIELTGFYAYSPYFAGGTTVACGDVTGDGIAEIITGAGPGGGPHVRVWQYTPIGQTVTELTGFYAYSPYFGGGARVAAADVTGDGIAEIITGAGPGGGPHIRVWQYTPVGQTVTELTGFWGDAPDVPTGMFVGAGDIDGDGVAEIISGPGIGSEPDVRVWSFVGGVLTLRAQFLAYGQGFLGGSSVTTGDLDGDGVVEVITGAGPGGGPHVRAWRVSGGTAAEVSGFFAYSPYFAGGTTVAAGDMDGDGVDELITGAGPGGGPHVRVWKLVGNEFVEVTGWFAYDPAFGGGAFVGR